MDVIPIPEIEAELLARGVLVKQWLRDLSVPQQGPSPPFLLVDGLPQFRTLTQELGRWVGVYLSPEHVKEIASIPRHLQWEAVRDEFLSNEQLLDLARRLGVASDLPEPRLKPSHLATEESLKAWWILQAKQQLEIRRTAA